MTDPVERGQHDQPDDEDRCLTVVGKDDAHGQMSDGLISIVNNDTTSMMRELSYKRASTDGSSFAAHTKEMPREGRENTLDPKMVRLQVGGTGTENPVTRLDQSDAVVNINRERRLNAFVLGDVVGAYADAQSLSGDVAQQRAHVMAIMRSMLTIVDKARIRVPPAAAHGTTASTAREWVKFTANGAIGAPTVDAGIRLEVAALAVEGRTGEPGVGDQKASAFNDALASVQRRARP